MPRVRDTRLSNPLRAALCGAFCVIVLTAMLVRHAWPLMTGEAIYLEVIPRDPRDLFRGDYVVLNYPIDQLTVRTDGAPPAANAGGVVVKPLGGWWDEIKKEMDVQDYYYAAGAGWHDRTLYVQLEPQPSQDGGVSQVHRPVSVSDEPIAGSVNLKGLIRSLYRNYSVDPNSTGGDPNQASTPGDLELTMHYGIDALFVQEGTGLQIEQAIRAGKVHAIVMVTASGDARLSDLLIDGKPWSSIIGGE